SVTSKPLLRRREQSMLRILPIVVLAVLAAGVWPASSVKPQGKLAATNATADSNPEMPVHFPTPIAASGQPGTGHSSVLVEKGSSLALSCTTATRSARPGNTGASAVAVWLEASFQLLDQNGDGVLSEDEMPPTLRAQLKQW